MSWQLELRGPRQRYSTGRGLVQRAWTNGEDMAMVAEYTRGHRERRECAGREGQATKTPVGHTEEEEPGLHNSGGHPERPEQ